MLKLVSRVLNVRFAILPLLALSMGLISTQFVYAQTTDPFPTSLHDVSRDGTSTDTNLTTANASKLTKLWSIQTTAPIASQAAIVNGTAYIGSWDGNEYAINATTGQVLWKTNLGTTFGGGNCNPQGAGVSSAATVLNGVVYVGGGDQNWYALNASTGAVEWKVLTGNAAGTYDGHYNWSSPLIVGNFAYVGVASLGDCPLIQGELLKVDITTHQIVATLKMVPDGQVGGGIWTSPSYDPATGLIYVVTGTEQNDGQTDAQAIAAIDSSSMTISSVWHLPETQAVPDSDWTTSAMLYTDSGGRQLVLATNKNGVTYAFLRSNIAAGPVWQQKIAVGNDCAACGFSTVSSAAFSQNMVFQAGGLNDSGGTGTGGSVQAWDPATGTVKWSHPLTGPVIGALTYDNGMVLDGGGSAFEVLNATNGQRLYSYDTSGGNWFYAAPAVSGGVIVTGNTGGTIYGFGLGSPTNPPADPNCPTGWTCQDIGNPKPTGSETVTSGTWNVTSGGGGFGNAADSFRYMSQSINGDGQIAAKVTNLQSIGAGSEAGVMIRQGNDPGSTFYAVYDTPNGVKVAYRNTNGGNTTVINDSSTSTLPIFVEIQRTGDQMQAATSTDGTTWTLVPGSTTTVVVPFSTMAGLAASSGVSGTSGTATFTNVTVGAASNTPKNTPSANACPTGWTCSDIGNPSTVGNQTVSGNSWSVSGAGTGITNYNQSDQFHYVYQTVAGDTTATTQITGTSGGGVGAYGGIMMRASNAPGAPYYGAFVTPGGNLVIQDRTENGLPVFQALATITSKLPQYIEVIRSGTTFTTYTSSDGNNWSPVVGSTDTVANLSGSLLAGFAVTSATPGTLSTVTANGFTVSNGASTDPPTNCPGNWTCTDVGPAIPAGSQDYYNGTWSVLGGGKDIYGTVDEMHLIGQTMNGNGSISVHISSQGDTDPWAKAGLVVRTDTSAGSAYYGIFVTPETNGTIVQYRPNANAATSQVAGVTSKAPTWLKITRSGNTFTAFTSTDGNTWTAYPGATESIPSIPTSAMVGMASTSHSQFGTNTTNFDSLAVTPANVALPSPWVDNDIDNATPAGSASDAGGVFTVKGGGNDIWGTNYATLDQSHYVSQPLSGDGSIVARVTAQTNTSAWAKSGIMIKQSNTADAPYALLAVTPSNGIVFQSNFKNSVSGGASSTLPIWLKLTRSGSTVTAYTSPDGNTWTQVGSTSLTLNNPASIGLVVCSHNSGTANTTTFDNVTVNSGTQTTGLPSPWLDTDIDNPTPAGTASYATGVFTVAGGGNDIWGTPDRNLDQFHYVYQPLPGDGTIIARITSQTNTSDWAKAGVMIKQSTTAGTNYALLGTTPTNGITFQYNFTGSVSGGNYTFPVWLKLVRSGITVTASTSPDGKTWTQVGTTTLTLTNPATIGLFVCSHNAGALSTANFDNVTVTSS